MKKVTIPIIVLLVVIAGFFGYQYQVNTNEISKLNETKEQLTTEVSQLESKLDSAQNSLSEANANLETMQADLKKTQDSLQAQQETVKKLQEDKSRLNSQIAKLNGVMCGMEFSGNDVAASTNQGLIDPITKMVERDFRITSVSTTFELVWNNSKTAIFVIKDSSNSSVQVVVTWDFDRSIVNGIYNVNQGCMYYKK